MENSTDQAQFVKLVEELGELAGNIARGRSLSDDIGDMIVVLINIAERNSLSINECLTQSWGDIEHRKGHMSPGGIFIKEEDLESEI